MPEENNESPSKFSRAVESTKYVLGKTLKTALKGAAIGGIALGVLSLPVAAPLGLASMVGSLFGANMTLGTGAIVAAATQGAILGGAAGGLFGFASGVSNVEDAVDDMEQAAETKAIRQRQLAANREMMEINMERMRASQRQMAMGGMSHGLGGMGLKQSAGFGVENIG